MVSQIMQIQKRVLRLFIKMYFKVSGIHFAIILANLLMEAAGSGPFMSQNKSNSDLGLGLDWGVLFSRADFVYTAVKSDEVKEDTDAPPKSCDILEKKKKYLGGVCSA